jgi:hypothetical protein
MFERAKRRGGADAMRCKSCRASGEGASRSCYLMYDGERRQSGARDESRKASLLLSPSFDLVSDQHVGCTSAAIRPSRRSRFNVGALGPRLVYREQTRLGCRASLVHRTRSLSRRRRPHRRMDSRLLRYSNASGKDGRGWSDGTERRSGADCCFSGEWGSDRAHSSRLP